MIEVTSLERDTSAAFRLMRLAPLANLSSPIASQNPHWEVVAMSQATACARCDKKDCSVVVIIPAVPDNMKRVDHAKQRLEIVCPAAGGAPFEAVLAFRVAASSWLSKDRRVWIISLLVR